MRSLLIIAKDANGVPANLVVNLEKLRWAYMDPYRQPDTFIPVHYDAVYYLDEEKGEGVSWWPADNQQRKEVQVSEWVLDPLRHTVEALVKVRDGMARVWSPFNPEDVVVREGEDARFQVTFPELPNTLAVRARLWVSRLVGKP